MREYWIWLAARKGMGNKQKLELAARFSDINALWQAETYEGLTPSAQTSFRDKDLTEARRICAQCDRLGIFVLTADDPQYPNRLRSIADPPLVLYGKGSLPDFDREAAVAVVGTRRASAYGLMAAERMGGELALCGGLVVSGMAAGIDAQAAWGALRAGRPTVAVLGGGVDVIYPASNRSLYESILQRGCILSEYPPGTKPTKWTFPKRNRIVSGLSCAVLAVEAPENSGTMITARLALEQGRDLFVVPGHIASAFCAGSNALLRDGAAIATCGWDILSEYQGQFPDKLHKAQYKESWELPAPKPMAAPKPAMPKPVAPPAKAEPPKNDLLTGVTDEEQKLLQPLLSGDKTVDDLIALSGLETKKVLALLTMLELKGMLQILPGRRVTLS